MPDDKVQGQDGQTAEGGQAGAQPQTYEVTIGGEKKNVTLDDLQKSYMMQEDYTRKTQKLSDDRKSLDTLVDEKATQLHLEALAQMEAEGKLPLGKEKAAAPSGEGTIEGEGKDDVGGRIAKLEKAILQQGENHQTAEHDRFFDGAERELSGKYEVVKNPKEWREILMIFSDTFTEDQNPMEVLEHITKEVQAEFEKTRQGWIDNYVKSKTSTKSKIGETGATGSPVGENKTPPQTLKEARERMEARLEASQS